MEAAVNLNTNEGRARGRGLDNQSSPELAMYPPKGIKPFHRPICATPLPTSSPKLAWSADCGLTTPFVITAALYGRRNEHRQLWYPCGNTAVNITMANRRNGWPKQKPQAASTDHSSMFLIYGGICTTPTCLKYIKTPRENAHNPSP